MGALANLGHCVSDQTVGNILDRHGIGPAPKRSQTIRWKDFIASHMFVVAGMDFFTVEVLTWRGNVPTLNLAALRKNSVWAFFKVAVRIGRAITNVLSASGLLQLVECDSYRIDYVAVGWTPLLRQSAVATPAVE